MARRIVVIGGGVVGCSVAWHLAQRNLGEVLLIERDRIGSGTTWHSAGNLTWRPAGRFGDKAKDTDWLKRAVSDVVGRGYQQVNL